MVFSYVSKCGNPLCVELDRTREKSQMLSHDIFCFKDIFRVNMRSNKVELSTITDFKRNDFRMRLQPASYLVSIQGAMLDVAHAKT